jgi:hypothetical protein
MDYPAEGPGSQTTLILIHMSLVNAESYKGNPEES